MPNAPSFHRSLISLGYKSAFIFLISIFLFYGFSLHAYTENKLLSWDDNPDADYYIVYWKAAGEMEYSHSSDRISSGAPYFQLVSSGDGKQYCYAVKAFNNYGNSSDFSDEFVGPYLPYGQVSTFSSTTVTTVMTAEIILPEENIISTAGVTIEFSANVYYNSDLTLTPSVTWTSSIDGFLGTGMDIQHVLSPGIHTIIALAGDSQGRAASDTRLVMVEAPNTPPSISVITAKAGVSGSAGQAYQFSASSMDLQEGDLSGTIIWSSSISGKLGSGSRIEVTLAPGTHVITARSTDSKGASSISALSVVSTAYNSPPVVTILDYKAGTSSVLGQTFEFSGNATDYEDGDISSKIVWTSSLSGSLGTGSRVTPTLCEGEHTIAARITDSKGKISVNTVVVSISPYNSPPTVTLTGTVKGNSVAGGQTYTLTARATDPEDGDLGSRLTWTSSLTGSLGKGASITTVLSQGIHTIKAIVTDSKGKTGSAETRITVDGSNTPPVVSILSATPGSTGTGGQTFTLTGIAKDIEDGSLSPSIAWTSSMAGPLGTGESIQVNLPKGTQTVTATVTDSGGKTASQSVQVTAAADNATPVLTITSASPGTLGENGQPYRLTGTATDAEDGNLSVSITWTSSRDGVLGTGSSVQPILSPGLHTITASVSDKQGKKGSTTLTITVERFNTAPKLTIITSEPGTQGTSGQSYRFSATASDTEDGSLSWSILWTSSRDGNLGTGGMIQPTLSAGSHIITASVVDSSGSRGSATVTVTATAVNAAPVITITSAVPGANDSGGQRYTLTGKATDKEDGDLSPSITWTANTSRSMGRGSSIQPILPPGQHTITAKVTDKNGKSSIATRIVTIKAANTPPVLSSVTCTEKGFNKGEAIYECSGSATDAEDGNLTVRINWASSMNGPFGTGSPVTPTFSPGAHSIRASVSDSQGLTVEKSLTITVRKANSAPVLTAISMLRGSGRCYTFSSSANDIEDGDISGSIAWTVDSGRSIGRGTLARVELTTGSHTVTASVTDSQGATSRLTKTVSVSSANTAPYVAITQTIGGASGKKGQAFQLKGQAIDGEDGDISSGIVWSSSRDGSLGKGASLMAILTAGTHVIKAVSVDSGRKSTATTQIIVVKPYNTPPRVRILKSLGGTRSVTGQIFNFTGSAADTENGSISQGIKWRSSQDGDLGQGARISAPLSQGIHTITACAEDNDGKEACSSIRVTAQKASAIIAKVTSYRFYSMRWITVSWSGSSSSVAVYRNGDKIGTGGSQGHRTFWNTGAGEYKVCEEKGGICSPVQVLK
jgi:hypothetical protein